MLTGDVALAGLWRGLGGEERALCAVELTGAAVGRPTLLRVPSPALSLAFGPEMARETVLISQRVRPGRDGAAELTCRR